MLGEPPGCSSLRYRGRQYEFQGVRIGRKGGARASRRRHRRWRDGQPPCPRAGRLAGPRAAGRRRSAAGPSAAGAGTRWVPLFLSRGPGISGCARSMRDEVIVMSFVRTLNNLALKKSELLQRFEQLIAPKSNQALEAMAQGSRALTLQNFGRTIRLFAPLYLSNECINNCQYCGFSRDNPILRVTRRVADVVDSGRTFARQGSRHIFLVAREQRKMGRGTCLTKC